MAKRFYVSRGGRDMCITSDSTQALLVAKNKPERVHEFSNYNGALKLFKRMVDSAIEHSEKPKGDFIHLDVSVNLQNGLAEFRVMQNDRYLISANSWSPEVGHPMTGASKAYGVVHAMKNGVVE